MARAFSMRPRLFYIASYLYITKKEMEVTKNAV